MTEVTKVEIEENVWFDYFFLPYAIFSEFDKKNLATCNNIAQSLSYVFGKVIINQLPRDSPD